MGEVDKNGREKDCKNSGTRGLGMSKYAYNLGEDLKDSLEKFGWSSRVVLKLEGVLVGDVEYMLRDCTCHEVKKAWMMEAEGKLKVGMEKNLEDGCKARCVRVVVAETENSDTHRTLSREREYPSKPEIMTHQRLQRLEIEEGGSPTVGGSSGFSFNQPICINDNRPFPNYCS